LNPYESSTNQDCEEDSKSQRKLKIGINTRRVNQGIKGDHAAQHKKIFASKSQIKINNNTKLALFDGLWNWFIQSYAAMDATVKALAPDPLQSVHVSLLTESLDSAKILLSKVSIHHLLILDCFSGVL
jgi:hypothetical protein